MHAIQRPSTMRKTGTEWNSHREQNKGWDNWCSKRSRYNEKKKRGSDLADYIASVALKSSDDSL